MVNFYKCPLCACEDVYSLTTEWSILLMSIRSSPFIVWLNSTFPFNLTIVKDIKNSYHVCGLSSYPLNSDTFHVFETVSGDKFRTSLPPFIIYEVNFFILKAL